MAETKFTPGPWAIDWCDRCIVREGVADICHMDPCASSHDAHLIAAAPEMYHMLEVCRDIFGVAFMQEQYDAIEALLAKARGEA